MNVSLDEHRLGKLRWIALTGPDPAVSRQPRRSRGYSPGRTRPLS
jgi:hypothetical protein